MLQVLVAAEGPLGAALRSETATLASFIKVRTLLALLVQSTNTDRLSGAGRPAAAADPALLVK